MLPLAAHVKTLQEAVQLSLKAGLQENSLFTFARALQAFEITNGIKLAATELPAAFALWWGTAKSQLPVEADFDEYRFVFEAAWERATTPLGANPLQEAIRRADTQPPPPEAARYGGPGIKRLVAVCHHLQALAGDAPIFLSVRDAARIARVAVMKASAMLAGLERDGIMAVESKGVPSGRRATRFRFNYASPVATQQR